MALSSSLEDYLEAMHDLMNTEGKIRVTDISERLKVEKSSVNTAVNKLQNLNLVIHEKYGEIFLTQEGKNEAERVKKRHVVILKFLTDFLALPKSEAENDACRMEHVISTRTFRRLTGFIEFLDTFPLFEKEKWKKAFIEYMESLENQK